MKVALFTNNYLPFRGGVTTSVETLRRVAKSLLAHGRVRRGFLGVASLPVQLSPAVASKLVSEFAQIARKTDERALRPKLTDRELEVLQLAADGLTNRQIGRKLHISENTVKNHMRNILEKLHLHSRMEAVVYAVREKLLEIN